MIFIGNLRQDHLSDVLRLIGDGMRRGRLVVERSGLRADLYCENGYLTYLWRSGTMPPLAQQWLSANLVPYSVLAQVGAQLQADPLTLSDTQLAQAVSELGYLSQEQLAKWAMDDAINLLGILVSWSDGDYRFEDSMVPPAGRLRIPLAIPQVLSTLVQRTAAWQVAHPTITVDLNDVLDFAEIDVTYPQSIHISHEQWQLLNLADGESSIHQIAERLTLEAGYSPQLDLQRYEMELRRWEDNALRIVSELVNEGFAVVMARR